MLDESALGSTVIERKVDEGPDESGRHLSVEVAERREPRRRDRQIDRPR
jgi:hypothetical protein